MDNWLGTILIGQAFAFVIGGFLLGWNMRPVQKVVSRDGS